MKIPAWFKIIWWCVLTAAAGVLFFAVSWPYLLAGDYSGLDFILLGVWLLLLLMPLVGEFNFLGMGYKREVEELKQEVKSQLLTLRSEIQNSASVTSHISPQIFLGTVPTDRELDQLEKQAGAILSKDGKPSAKARSSAPAGQASPTVPAANQQLFVVRFELERQLKRLALEHGLATERGLRQTSGLQIAGWLRDEGIIHEKFYPLLRDVYGICNMGVHAVAVTPKQADFVRRLAPGLIAALNKI